MRFLPLSLLFVSLALTACDGQEMRETVGLTREAPDEFVVVSRPPLSVPPDFSLKPPRPGEQRKEESTENQARQLILKENPDASSAIIEEMEPAPKSVATALDPVTSSEAKSSAESTLLNKFGVEKADPDIRKKLGQDSVAEKDTSDSKSLYEKLVKEDGEEPVVDAKKEAERIRKNKEKGAPINKGKVPEAGANKSVMDRLF